MYLIQAGPPETEMLLFPGHDCALAVELAESKQATNRELPLLSRMSLTPSRDPPVFGCAEMEDVLCREEQTCRIRTDMYLARNIFRPTSPVKNNLGGFSG